MTTITDKTTYTDTRSAQERNHISFQGRLMSMRQAKREGYVKLLHTPRHTGAETGGDYVGFTLPEEGKLHVTELDQDMRLEFYGEYMTIREAVEKGYIRLIKQDVTKYLPVGFEFLDDGIKTITRRTRK